MIFKSEVYSEELENAINETMPWDKLTDKTILITGASGLIGSCIVDIIMKRNMVFPEENITVLALGRDKEEAKNRFNSYLQNKNFKFIEHDITNKITLNQKSNYIIHAASNAHPSAYSQYPVNTILGNVIGLNNVFEYAIKNDSDRVLFISSGEVYGIGSENIKSFDEEYRGNIDYLDLRSGYPISKQVAENLCIAYSQQYNIESVIVRPCHIYGANFTKNDSRAFAQFFRNGMNNQDIILKSKGTQQRSYCYVIDCAIGILFALLKGENMKPYNISNKNSNITIFEFAQQVAKEAKVNIVFEEASETERKGFNKMQKAVLNSEKLEELGWIPKYSLEKGISHSLRILKEKIK